MILLFILCVVVICVSLFAVVLKREKKKDEAFKEYDDLVKKYGYYKAREHCPHKVIQFGQTGIPSVITITTKWCKLCGKDLGPAKLKESIF